MPRARNLKPGFFSNEDLAECSFEARLCFAGLWTLADREGRLEDRPKRIKGELFRFDNVDVDPLLDELERRRFILRYVVDGLGIIQVVEFSKHQNPHHREADSELPPPPSPGLDSGSNPSKPKAPPPLDDGKALDEPRNKGQIDDIPRGSSRADSLIPDPGSLIPDPGSLIPDPGSLKLDSSTPDGVGAIAAPKIAGAHVPDAPAPATPKGSRLLAEWKLPKAWGDWALGEYAQWGADKVRLEGEKFRDHWVAKTGKDSTKSDWLATWRNWCRSPIAHQDDPKTPAPPPAAATRAARHAEVRAALGVPNDDQEIIDAKP